MGNRKRNAVNIKRAIIITVDLYSAFLSETSNSLSRICWDEEKKKVDKVRLMFLRL